MKALSNDRMMTFHIPRDTKILAALGTIALRHGHLDHILKMTVKSLGKVSIQQALDATAFEGSRELRDRIRKLARLKMGEGNALIQLQALLERCRRATDRRNELIHSLWAQELDGDAKVRTNDHGWKPVPTIDELKTLSAELADLAKELNSARLEGFLAKAIAARK